MLPKKFVLTRAAAADLREIIRFTKDRWGKDQVKKYVLGLEKGMSEIAEGKGTYKEVSDLYPGLTVTRYARHFIFCFPQINKPTLVVAVLHEKMDLLVRIKDRLDNR